MRKNPNEASFLRPVLNFTLSVKNDSEKTARMPVRSHLHQISITWNHSEVSI